MVIKTNICSFCIVFFTSAVSVYDAVQVTVREEKRFAMLFQSIVLQCQYHTPSTQAPVVQWWYKSYCHDRTRDSFTFPEKFGVHTSDLGTTSNLECSDKSRTVRVVASGQGPSMTLAEHYKGRDIAIINKADLRIGELQWGDSGVYYCKVVIADDLEGKNEAQVELLVLEWVFVGVVVLGSILFLLLVGICWCQCCPHSCCCYLRCCCCPDTCCCPKHLYEAGKMSKSGQPPQVAMYPYYVPGVPSIVPVVPASYNEPQITAGSSIERNLPKSSSLSELSSLHDGGDTDFRQTYRTVQMKALPSITDIDELSVERVAPPNQGHRNRRDWGHHLDDEHDRRWNPRSEHLQRKTLNSRGRTGSLDELEEFARSYDSRARRGEPRDHHYDLEYRSSEPYPSYRNNSPPSRSHADQDDDWHRRSASPLPQKRRDTWDSDRPSQPNYSRGQGGSQGYDDAFLNSILERKARGRGGERGRAVADEDSDTPSRGSSKGKASLTYYSRSPNRRPEEDEQLPPYSEVERHRKVDHNSYRSVESGNKERHRTSDPANRPFSYTRPPQGNDNTIKGGRDEMDRNRKVMSYL